MIFRNWILQNFPFLEDDFDALTDYELFCKMMEYVKKFAKDNEEFNKRLTELENYINNLDLQDAVNNKLDEMVKDGTLENIIAEYLQLETLWVYDNIEEMKNATNLSNGMTVKTNGFYSKFDNGGNFYTIRNVTNEDVIDNMTIFALDNNLLVAEIIPENSTLSTSRLGFVENENNSSKFNLLSNIINKYNIKNVIIDKDYIIDDTVTLTNLNNINFEFKNLITATSYADSEKPVFELSGCSNISINGFNITSTLDKHEKAPAGHTRISYLGSGRVAIKLLNSENIYIKNSNFNNMNWNFFIHGDDTDSLTKNIYIDNCISNNTSIDLYSSYCNNININNYESTPKMGLGLGNHLFYFERYSNLINLQNINVITDEYMGYPFEFNNADNAQYNNININNCYVKSSSLLFISTVCNNTIINNIKFEYQGTNYNELDTIQIAGGEVNINDIYVNNKNNNNRFLRLNTNATVTIDNLYVDSTYEDNNTQFFAFGSTGNNLLVKNSNIKCQILFFQGNANNDMKFINCNFYTTTSQYFQSVRNANSKSTFINCFVTSKNFNNFSYQANNTYANTVYIYGSYLNGFNKISATAADAGFNIINSYKNGVLISTW